MNTSVVILTEDSRKRQILRRIAESSGHNALAFDSVESLKNQIEATAPQTLSSTIVVFDAERFPELLASPYVLIALVNDSSFEARNSLQDQGAFDVLPNIHLETHAQRMLARASRMASLEDDIRALRERALKEFSASWPTSFRADLSLQEIERRYIAHVLKTHGGVQETAARALGIDRKTLYRKRKEIAAELAATERKARP